MNRGFWGQKNEPWLVLAPMADVTDVAFRRIVARYGKPDVLWTEFVSCDGLMSKGQERLLRDLEFVEGERPIVAQLFGKNPKKFYEAAVLCRSLGFDGIDINMGCPEKNICRSGSCSALIKTPDLAKEIVYSTMEGAGGVPVSVKTRLGYNTNVVEEWIGALLETKPVVITLHGRTRKQMSKVAADWQQIAKAAKMTSETETLLIGNGDIGSVMEAKEVVSKYGVDGVMMGRAIFGNPWLFSIFQMQEVQKLEVPFSKDDLLEWKNEFGICLREKLEVMLEHAFLYEELLGDIKPFHIMRKHFKAYVAGYPYTKELKMELMETESAKEAKDVVERFLRSL